ncbi:MAG TPA: L-threonylcarbamoyladenylate synthase, partial [Longimicrobiaceae bacterium]|nr:L-threonylcarbamoyladenylate synthase [Longimicrobiaceae bacterium]
MPTITVDPSAPAAAALARAAAVLRRGGLVAFPTETVYGLGANALDADAVRRIFAAKGRPSYNPLIAHVAGAAAARELVTAWPDAAEQLAAAFWPGPLTLVLPKRAIVPDVVTAGLDTVAVRVPAHPVAHALLAAAGLPVAAPSANRFTQLSPTTAAHVERALGDRVDLILDGGPTTVGIESTVIDLSGERPVLLRPGSIALDALERIVGPLERPAASAAEAPRPSPGMLD